MTDATSDNVSSKADATTQRISGVTLHGNKAFDMAFLTHVRDNLFQGGCTNGLVLPKGIDHVVSLYPWEQYTVQPPGLLTMLTVEMFDSETDDAFDTIEAVSDWVVACMKTGPTLVHCQAGLNRSGVVAARALMKTYDMTADDAIRLLREQRSPSVLCNRSFEAWLLRFDDV